MDGKFGLDYNSNDLSIYDSDGTLVAPGEPALSATSQTIDLKGLVADTSLKQESITLLYFAPAATTTLAGNGSSAAFTGDAGARGAAERLGKFAFPIQKTIKRLRRPKCACCRMVRISLACNTYRSPPGLP